MTQLEQEDLNMSQARNEAHNIVGFWIRERGFSLSDVIYMLKDTLNYYEYQNREDMEFDDGDDWGVVPE